MKLWTQTLNERDLERAAELANADHPGLRLVVVGREYTWREIDHSQRGTRDAFDDPVLYVGPRTRYFDKVFIRDVYGNPVNTCWRCKGSGEDGEEPPADCHVCNGAGWTNGEVLRPAGWCAHGWWMVKVFEMDPHARIKVAFGHDYNGVSEFHRITGYRYADPRTPRERQMLRIVRSAA